MYSKMSSEQKDSPYPDRELEDLLKKHNKIRDKLLQQYKRRKTKRKKYEILADMEECRVCKLRDPCLESSDVDVQKMKPFVDWVKDVTNQVDTGSI